MTQVEVAELLGRHKSWVCRRLALVEKLTNEAREDLRLGLLSTTTAARALVRLPPGNQVDVLATLRRDELTAAELDGVVDLLLTARGQSQEEYILAQPRPALQQARQQEGWAWDPRLSQAGNRVARRLASVLDGLGRMEVWLQSQGRAGLTPCDRLVLTPAFSRLARDAHTVATLAEDLMGELHTHDRIQTQSNRQSLASRLFDAADRPRIGSGPEHRQRGVGSDRSPTGRRSRRRAESEAAQPSRSL